MKVNILGVDYKICFKTEQEDAYLKTKGGYCDYTIKEIVLVKFTEEEKKAEGAFGNFDVITKDNLRHEIIHAFMYESGLWYNSYSPQHWATNEEMTDWFALQFPKIYKVYKQLNILD